MKRSRFRNKFLREKNQANFCKKLLGKTKNSYFSNFDTKKLRIIELFEK